MNIRGKYSLPHWRFSRHATTVTPVQYTLLQSPSLPFHTIPFYIFVSFMAALNKVVLSLLPFYLNNQNNLLVTSY